MIPFLLDGKPNEVIGPAPSWIRHFDFTNENECKIKPEKNRIMSEKNIIFGQPYGKPEVAMETSKMIDTQLTYQPFSQLFATTAPTDPPIVRDDDGGKRNILWGWPPGKSRTPMYKGRRGCTCRKFLK